jgi:hypothetical protein
MPDQGGGSLYHDAEILAQVSRRQDFGPRRQAWMEEIIVALRPIISALSLINLLWRQTDESSL